MIDRLKTRFHINIGGPFEKENIVVNTDISNQGQKMTAGHLHETLLKKPGINTS